MSSPKGNLGPSYAQSSASYSAFLAGNDGRIIGDIGDQLLGSNKSIPARSLVDIMKPASLLAFLEAVRTQGTTLGWKMGLHDGRSVGSLLLYGSQTPFGIIVFATLTPGLATLPGDRSVASGTSPIMAKDEDYTASQLTIAIHDLKNPISSIISACDYLVEYSPENLNPEQLQMITEIDSAATSLLQLSERIAELGHRQG